MLLDVKVRTFDRASRTETTEIITVDAGSGDDAALLAQALRPQAMVVGVTGKGGFGPVGGASLEADDNPADDEDAEPPPSNRELAMMQPAKRGPGRPRKEPAS
jgi:hypothetical protein